MPTHSSQHHFKPPQSLPINPGCRPPPAQIPTRQSAYQLRLLLPFAFVDLLLLLVAFSLLPCRWCCCHRCCCAVCGLLGCKLCKLNLQQKCSRVLRMVRVSKGSDSKAWQACSSSRRITQQATSNKLQLSNPNPEPTDYVQLTIHLNPQQGLACPDSIPGSCPRFDRDMNRHTCA
jgi:hypothetical protein